MELDTAVKFPTTDQRRCPRIDDQFVVRFMGMLDRDRNLLSNPNYMLLHDPDCHQLDGVGRCTCDSRLVAFRCCILLSFYRILHHSGFISANVISLSAAWLMLSRHPGGRPTKYGKAVAIKIGLLQLTDGKTLAEALEICGISYSTVKRWRKRYPLFNAMMFTIRKGRLFYPEAFSRRVLTQRKRTEGGTLIRHKSRPMATLYRPEMVQWVQPSIRRTAKALGVSPTTIHRWSNLHYMEFGAYIALSRFDEAHEALTRKFQDAQLI